jgi:hypothetical protein
MRTNAPEMIPRLKALLPFGARIVSGEKKVDFLCSFLAAKPSTRRGLKRFHLFYADATEAVKTLDLDAALEQIEVELRKLVADHSRREIFVHAGVVEWRGRAIVIAGKSFTGKSSLTAAFVRAGARYFSDEFALIDAAGRVRPYPKPLSLRLDGEMAKAVDTPVEDLGGTQGKRAVEVGCILFTRYRKGSRWRPRRLTPGETVLALLKNTIPARRRPKDALARLRSVALAAEAFQGTRGEASEMVRQFLTQLDWEVRS